MSDFLNRLNTKKSPKKESTINLSKKGSSHSIDLKKNNNELSFNLNWNTKIETKSSSGGLFGKIQNRLVSSSVEIDLDLACMYRLKNGKQGVVQAIGKNFGSLVHSPYILLDGDDRSGENSDGETLKFGKIEEIELVVVFAFIYGGAINWKEAEAIATIKQPNSADIIIKLEDSSSKTHVGIAMLLNENNILKVEKLEKYYSGHKNIDDDFRFGFNWTQGSK